MIVSAVFIAPCDCLQTCGDPHWASCAVLGRRVQSWASWQNVCWLSSSVIRIFSLWHALFKTKNKSKNVTSAIWILAQIVYCIALLYILSSRVIWLFLQIDLKKIIPVHSLLLAFGKLIRGEVNLSWVWVKEKTYNFQQLKDFFKTLPRTGRWSTCITIWCKTTRAPRRGQWGRGCPDAPVPAPPPAPAADAGRPGEQCWTCSAWARGLRKHTLLSVWFSVSQLSA